MGSAPLGLGRGSKTQGYLAYRFQDIARY